MSFVKNVAAGAVLGGSLIFTAGLGMANAQPVEAPDGLVSIAVGDVTILENVPAEAAASTAGALCASTPAEVGALAAQVDSEGTDQTVCSGLPGGDLVLTQNVSSSDEQPEAPESTEAPEGSESTDGATAPGDAEATAPADGG